jgi:formylglycine-generating enzyme required for sulfatase activity
MELTGSQFKQIQEALLAAFNQARLRQMVRVGLGEYLPLIADGQNLTEVVFNLVAWAEQQNRIAELIIAAVAENPSNELLSRLVEAASAWPELASTGLVLFEGIAYVYAPRHLELAYLDKLMQQYEVWAEKYTPLAGIAEVRGYPNLVLPMRFMPTGFEKVEEPDFDRQREVKRVPVADLREAVTTYKRLVLLGEPGAGKTTTLWRLAYDLAEAARHDAQAPLPLLVPLGGYTGSEPALDYAKTYFGTLGPHLQAYLHQGRVVFLLDGLNEMPQHGYRERVDRIQTLLERFHRAPALVTCRALDYETVEKVLNLEKLEVKPLDPERQRAYLHRYLGAEEGEKLFWQLAGADVGELWEDWQKAGGTWQHFWAEGFPPEPPRVWWVRNHLGAAWAGLRRGDLLPLLALGTNPYMLAMLAQVYASQQGALPQNRGKLFEFFVDWLLAREQERCDPAHWPGAQPLLEALSALAFAMQTAGGLGTSVDKAWALEQLGDGCDPEQVLHLAAGATLLELAGDRVRFVHQLIQEYFAAVAWQVKWEAGADLADQWPDGWISGWEETAVLLAGILPPHDPAAMLRWVDDLLAVNPPLAARCIAAGGGVQPDAACIAHVQDQLVAIATGTELAVWHRAHAGAALNFLGDPRRGVGLKDGLPDIAWCPVPAGEFLMGNTTQTDEMADEYYEAPQHKLYLEDFAIAKYPVTNAQFEAFVRDGGYTERWHHCWTKAGWRWRTKDNVTGPRKFGVNFDRANHPVVGVSWYEAVAFCKWLSEKLGQAVMLPSEAQWEKAARGTDGRRYPWGQQITVEHANYLETFLHATSAVGIFPLGKSPYGVLDMAGNVNEWTSSKYMWYPYDTNPFLAYLRDPRAALREMHRVLKLGGIVPQHRREDPEGDDIRVLRGGAGGTNARSVRCANRYGYNPHHGFDRFGDDPHRGYDPVGDRGVDAFGFRVVVSPGR